MTEKRFTTQRIYKGFDGEKIYDWCVMDYDNVLLRLTTRMDCKDVCEELNALHEERSLMARGWDNYQAKVGYVIGKYGRMYNRQSDEFQLIECIAEELGFDLESMEAKDD